MIFITQWNFGGDGGQMVARIERLQRGKCRLLIEIAATNIEYCIRIIVSFLRNGQVSTLVNWLAVSTSVSTSGWKDSINVRTLWYQYLVNILSLVSISCQYLELDCES